MSEVHLPAIRATAGEIVAHRNAALEAYERSYRALTTAQAVFSEAHEFARLATGGVQTSINAHLRDPGAEKVKLHVDVAPIDDFKRVARHVVDAGVWARVVQMTGLESLMDKKAKDELRQSMLTDPPEVTEDNILATVENFALQANEIFQRGIAEAFSNLDPRFKSHDGWKIGSRVILSHAFDSWGSWSYHHNRQDTLSDIERTFRVLDGKRPDEPFNGVVDAIRAERGFGGGARQSEIDADYFKVRIFRNGNAHLWFKRDDLVERVNKLLAEYYGAVIPEERRERPKGGGAPKTTPAARDFAFFPTPPELAARVVDEHAALYRRDGDAQLRVLEPSAGAGALAMAASKQGAIVDCVEMESARAAGLRAMGVFGRVICADFLRVAPDRAYDRVVMNPPFDRERDIDHVLHALKFLKPGGRLVSIMSAGTRYRETRKSADFRALVERHGGRIWDLPPRSFSSVGTNCNTVVVIMNGAVA